MKKAILLVAFVTFSFASNAQKITDGTWYNEEKTSRVQLYMQGDKLFGKVVWLETTHEDGKPRTDKNNPNTTLAKEPLMGLVFLKGFEKEDDETWEEGTIYDPNNGKTYSSIITVISPNKLDVRGYIGFSFIGRSSEFTRATN